MTTDVENVIPANAGNQDVMKGRQADEAKNRQPDINIEVTDGPGEDAVVSDAAGAADAGNTDQQGAPEPKKPRWFQDEMRDSIVSNFRRNRDAKAQEGAEDADEIAEFMRSGGMPKEFQDTFVDEEPQSDTGQGEEPVAEVRAEPEPQQPRKFKIKVNGKELELTEEELIARAQKTEAADEYFNDAKTLLNEAKALKRDLESRPSPAATPAADRAAPEDQTPPAGDPNQVDPFKDVTEALLYGDPEQAAGKLRQLMTNVVPTLSRQTSEAERRQTELNRSRMSGQRFERDNPDLAGNEFSAGAIEARVYANQRKDLVDMGLDDAKLPKSKADIANMHLTFRSDPKTSGLVRPFDKLLDDAKADFLNWRGGPEPKPTNGNGATPHERTSPEIQVSVQRDDRRRAIQPQPSRTAVVRQAVPTAPPPKTRSQTIAEMRKQRGQV
jgi:hypothetical protein